MCFCRTRPGPRQGLGAAHGTAGAVPAAAADAQEREDTLAYESYMAEIKAINSQQKELNKQIAYYGRRLECHFGLFSHYGDLAKHPELSKRFKGKDFILNQLDDIESIHAEFNEMIEEGMKISMEDMEDLMDEMRDKMKDYKEKIFTFQ